MPRVEKKLISSIQRTYIIDYFVSICISYDGKDNFKGHDWEVEVSKEEYRRLGSIKLPSTQIFFCGDEDLVNDMIQRFRVKFLSAGG